MSSWASLRTFFAISSRMVAPELFEPVAQLTDALDAHPHNVAALQEPRRLQADADAGRRARRDDVARQQRHAGRERLHQAGDVEDQVPGVGLLADLVVDPAP